MKHYHLTLIGYEKLLDGGTMHQYTAIKVVALDVISGVKQAKNILHKKHYSISEIIECYHGHCFGEDTNVQNRVATAMEEMAQAEKEKK